MQNPIAKFLLRIIIIFTPVLVIVLIAMGMYAQKHYLPCITPSICLDAKIYESKKIAGTQIELVAIGSSMTLNNLNSRILKQNTSLSYYNFGAWGLQMSDIRSLLYMYALKFKPRFVIVCSSIPDFKNNNDFDLPKKMEYLASLRFKNYFYVKNMSIFGLAKRNREYGMMRTNINDYSNLKFDEFGGIELSISKANIKKERWNQKFRFPTKNTEFQYDEFDKLASELEKQQIKLIFVQTPIRSPFFGGEADNNQFIKHCERSRSITENRKGRYLNFHNPAMYVDSLFVDQFHLSAYGSQLFTQQLCDSIHKMIAR